LVHGQTTYREIDAAWWRWASEQIQKRTLRLDLMRKMGQVPFQFDGTTWTVRLDPVYRKNGTINRFDRSFVGTDGRVLEPTHRVMRGAS
jgi:hypothetical protein